MQLRERILLTVLVIIQTIFNNVIVVAEKYNGLVGHEPTVFREHVLHFSSKSCILVNVVMKMQYVF